MKPRAGTYSRLVCAERHLREALIELSQCIPATPVGTLGKLDELYQDIAASKQAAKEALNEPIGAVTEAET